MNIAVIGLGFLGKIHVKCLKQTHFSICGVYDIDEALTKQVAAENNTTAFKSLDALFDACDAVSIVSDTATHYEIAKKALEKGKHVFVEKPLTANLKEANALLALKQSHPQIKLQVGHIERYNPALVSLEGFDLKPQFVEIHRLAQYNIRGTDVSVVMDLMIHDLDVLMMLMQDEVIDIQAKGVNLFSNNADICNARLTFKRGCVVNITASRISMKAMRKMRIFQADAYVNIDFLEKQVQIINLTDEAQVGIDSMPIETQIGTKYVSIKTNKAEEQNSIVLELQDFYNSIVNNSNVSVSIKDAVKAITLAHKIEEALTDSKE